MFVCLFVNIFYVELSPPGLLLFLWLLCARRDAHNQSEYPVWGGGRARNIFHKSLKNRKMQSFLPRETKLEVCPLRRGKKADKLNKSLRPLFPKGFQTNRKGRKIVTWKFGLFRHREVTVMTQRLTEVKGDFFFPSFESWKTFIR